MGVCTAAKYKLQNKRAEREIERELWNWIEMTDPKMLSRIHEVV